jgi:hypothetical protein
MAETFRPAEGGNNEADKRGVSGGAVQELKCWAGVHGIRAESHCPS